MSFIDYNFFPVLFFLGWNILTCKQLKPITYQTSDLKTPSTVPVFSLIPSKFQKTSQNYSKHEKGNSIVEFVTGFRFLSKNKTALGVLSTSTNDKFVQLNEETNISRIARLSQNSKSFFNSNTLAEISFSDNKKVHLRSTVNNQHTISSLDVNKDNRTLSKPKYGIESIRSENNLSGGKKFSKFYPSKDSNIRNHQSYHSIQRVIEPSKSLNLILLNGGSGRYFTNQNLTGNKWKENFKERIFDFSYRPHRKAPSDQTKTSSLFFSFIGKKKPESDAMKLWLNYNSPFSKKRGNGVFFGGLCSSQNSSVPWQKLQTQLGDSWVFNTSRFPFTNWFFRPKAFNDNSINKSMSHVCLYTETKTIKTLSRLYEGPERIKVAKRRSRIRLVLRTPVQKIYSLNRFQIALCFSKILQPPTGENFFKDLPRFNLTPKIDDQFMLKTEKFKPSTLILEKRFLDSAFVEHRQKTNYVGWSKKHWYMKTPFFQHVAWNMKYKTLNRFLDLESVFNPSGFSEKNTDWKEKTRWFSQNPLVKIYGGSWYYEDLLFPYSIFNTLVKTPRLDLQPSLEKGFELNPKTSSSVFKKSLESNIGIYSLAHKLASVGFRNSNSEIDIYPFKYNDSYRYNFQNMNLSNRQRNWYPPSDRSSNFRPFLDFQNPTFSKIYAPVFQPQGLNLLSFLYHSKMNVVATKGKESDSIRNFELIDFFTMNPKQKVKSALPNQIQPRLEEYLYGFKGSKKFEGSHVNPPTRGNFLIPIEETSDKNKPTSGRVPVNLKTTTSRRRGLNGLYPKLAVNGMHANPYPWITQNAFDRWTESKPLIRSLVNPGFSGSFEVGSASDYLSIEQAPSYRATDENPRGAKSLKEHNTSKVLTSNQINGDGFSFDTLTFQKHPLKNSNSQRHFSRKPSCIEKPSIFFSSFRHLPYFFISETLSTKNVILPETNLLLSNLPNHELEKLSKNRFHEKLSSQYSLFNNNVLKQNQNKRLAPWNDNLKYQSFSLKPLSTFLKKEVGYETSLFSKKTPNHWSKKPKKAVQKTDLTPLQKNTWKIYPPLFQPLTFCFRFLNLPRTWSSELVTGSEFGITPVKKKTFRSSSLYSSILSFFKNKKPTIKKAQIQSNLLAKTTKWNMTQKNFFRSSIPFCSSDFFGFSVGTLFSKETHSTKFISTPKQEGTSLVDGKRKNHENIGFYESALPFHGVFGMDGSKQSWNNGQKFEKKNERSFFNETPRSQHSKIIVYGEKPLLRKRTVHGPPLKNQKESISLPNYLKNITNQNYQNLCPNNLNELYFVFWILFNKTLFIYLSLHYLRKFISFLGTEYIRNLFKIFVTMKFIDGNILSIIKTFQDFNFQLNQQNIIDIKVNKQLKNIKRN